MTKTYEARIPERGIGLFFPTEGMARRFATCFTRHHVEVWRGDELIAEYDRRPNTDSAPSGPPTDAGHGVA